ncbi:peptidase M23 [Candidatus Pelagibacter giovannonii]|uniref:Peptidase M23 n=1 Tax=Candidatus Pelagibacter giovannonii TaxID=2563896 RepID=A0A6H1Q2X9_9PROT|nr:peptidoglycan DD-metalloendopeptidase family protein [Candidatus Pelagibacter giovannonii]QIZ20860.1 peptidase M23 [Candidatus Pelagibacter giovannonii]
MIFSSNKIIKIIKKNIEITFLFLLLLITILITSIYNEKKLLVSENYKNLINNIYFQKSINQIFDNLVPRYRNISHKISSGETFDKILNNYLIPNEEINRVKKKLNSDYDINNLKPNLEIKIIIDQSNNKEIISFLFPVSRTKKIQLTRNLGNNLFEKNIIITNLNKKIIFKEGKIIKSLYKTAIDLSVHPNVIIEFARIYGFQVDFQRDIRKNDNFQIMYEVFEDDDGKIFETGNIVFADLKLSGKNNALYYFKKKGSEGHYDENGKSVEKALMKTPINGARLSSPFGMRKHPIDGFNKMHRGTDFAAPMGTPIMASGSGLITRAKWCGGGGNCIKIKHNSTYETIYAHMKNFAKGIKEGIRVKQGQIIGYVGSTGKSTGPHLHYEVVVNGKKVNSQKLKLPSGKTLKGKERKIFEVEKIKLDVLKSELIIG